MILDRYYSEAQIEARAFDVLHRYARYQHPIRTPPVPIERIIEYVVDLPLVWDAIPDEGNRAVLAKLVVRRPRPEIVVNENKALFFRDYEGTEQFSLAHELGHYVLHVDQAQLKATPLLDEEEHRFVLCRTAASSQSDRREWQAERFAAYLLMPCDLLKQACAGLDLHRWPNVYQLKEQFHVTISAMTRRLKELHLIMVTADQQLVDCPQPMLQPGRSLWE